MKLHNFENEDSCMQEYMRKLDKCDLKKYKKLQKNWISALKKGAKLRILESEESWLISWFWSFGTLKFIDSTKNWKSYKQEN